MVTLPCTWREADCLEVGVAGGKGPLEGVTEDGSFSGRRQGDSSPLQLTYDEIQIAQRPEKFEIGPGLYV